MNRLPGRQLTARFYMEGLNTMMDSSVRESLDRYANKGIPTGGFLEAVLSNDLFEAIGRADVYNRDALPDICSYVYNHMPSTCWGSKKIVQEWLEMFNNDHT